VAGGDLPLSNRSLLALGREVLGRGLDFRFRANGWSMSPFIREGDVISLEPMRERLPRLGDVVAFVPRDVDNLVVHRVVSVKNIACLVKGDNIPGSPDGWIAPEQVLGRVSCVERNHRRMLLGLGPERALIAELSRINLLVPLLRLVAMFTQGMKK
jgi:signal peptidase I